MLVSAISVMKLWSWDYRDHCCFWNLHLQHHRNQAGRSEAHRERKKVKENKLCWVRQVRRLCKCLNSLSHSLFVFIQHFYLFHSSRCSAVVGPEIVCGCGDGFWAESWVNHFSVRQLVPTDNITQKTATIAAHRQSSEQSCRLVNVRCCGFSFGELMKSEGENCSTNVAVLMRKKRSIRNVMKRRWRESPPKMKHEKKEWVDRFTQTRSLSSLCCPFFECF